MPQKCQRNTSPSMLSVGWQNMKALKAKKPLDIINEEPIDGKIVVITGANAGLGAAAAFEMAKRGAIVGMCCRDIIKAEKIVEDIKTKLPSAKLELFALDLGSLISVRNCAEQVKAKFPHINILINNAGVMLHNSTLTKTKDGFESNMGINHLGHFLWTHLLLEHVKKGAPSRIVILSSMGHLVSDLNVDDLNLEKRGPFGQQNFGPYANSKLANMYFAKSLAKLLKDDKVTTYALCPGHVHTELNRDAGGFFMQSLTNLFDKMLGTTPEEGVTTTLYCSLSKACANETGLMYHHNAVWENAMENATNDEVEQKLWERSEVLVGLKQ